jgi:hypothetical protein
MTGRPIEYERRYVPTAHGLTLTDVPLYPDVYAAEQQRKADEATAAAKAEARRRRVVELADGPGYALGRFLSRLHELHALDPAALRAAAPGFAAALANASAVLDTLTASTA